MPGILWAAVFFSVGHFVVDNFDGVIFFRMVFLLYEYYAVNHLTLNKFLCEEYSVSLFSISLNDENLISFWRFDHFDICSCSMNLTVTNYIYIFIDSKAFHLEQGRNSCLFGSGHCFFKIYAILFYMFIYILIFLPPPWRKIWYYTVYSKYNLPKDFDVV